MNDEKYSIMDIMTYDTGLVNPMTGMGTHHDKQQYGNYVRRIMTGDECASIYRTNGIGRKVIDVPIDDMLNNWRKWDVENIDKIEDEEKRLGIKRILREAIMNADVFGGSIMVMFINGQDDLEAPLNLEAIGEGDLIKVGIFDRWLCSKIDINFYDILAENYLRPEFYQLLSPDDTMTKVHYSRVVELSGLDLPLYEKKHNLLRMWGDSRYNPMYETLKAFDTTHGGVATMVAEANVDIISIDGLPDISSTEMGEQFKKRMEMVKLGKSVWKTIIKDTSEEYERHTLSFTNLDAILGVFQTQMSAVSNIPVTKLFGTSAKGLNATGESDIHDYHEWLEGRQSRLTTDIQLFDEILCRSAGIDPESEYIWSPLRVETREDKMNNLALLGSAFATLQTVLKPEEIRAYLMDEGTFHIEDADDVPPPPPEDPPNSNMVTKARVSR